MPKSLPEGASRATRTGEGYPPYPVELRDANLESTLTCELLVGEDGRVRGMSFVDIEIVLTEGGLPTPDVAARAEAVLRAAVAHEVSRWLFDPARDGSGRPIASWLVQRFVFQLE